MEAVAAGERALPARDSEKDAMGLSSSTSRGDAEAIRNASVVGGPTTEEKNAVETEKENLTFSPPVRGLSGHASKSFPAPPSLSSSPLSSRAKMSLTGAGKMPHTTQSLAMRLLNINRDGVDKVHRARKTIPRGGGVSRDGMFYADGVRQSIRKDFKMGSRNSPDSTQKRSSTFHDAHTLSAMSKDLEGPSVPSSPAPGSSRGPDGMEVEDWEPDVGTEFSLFYDSMSMEDQGDTDSKEEEDEEEEGSGNQSERSSSSLKKKGKKKWKMDKAWLKPTRKRKRREREKPGTAASTVGGSQSEYTEVPLGSLDLPSEGTLSPNHTGVCNESSSMDTERFEELPLCSCRMEAPSVERVCEQANNMCMATESIDGELSGCNTPITKRETMRPSSRVPLMVLCESHRARMVKHHCCPGCGYFCTSGTFLECHPDFRINHRFHKACVSPLNGILFCPHCGEDASEAEQITIAKADTSVPVPAPPPHDGGGPGRADTTQPSARMSGVGDGKRSLDDPALNGDTEGPSVLLPSGMALSAAGLPPGPARDVLQKALMAQETDNLNQQKREGRSRKKIRYNSRQLYLSVKAGELQKVLLMLTDNQDSSFLNDQQLKRSPLHAAAQRGSIELCHILIQAGANFNATDKVLRTPLLEAVVNNHLDVAKYLAQSGACVYHQEEDGSTCLHHAAKSGNLEMLSFLLSTGQVNVNAQDNGGWTPIIWAAEHKHIDVIRTLLTRGADVTLQDNVSIQRSFPFIDFHIPVCFISFCAFSSLQEKNICLHWASFTGSAEIAEILLNAQCELHAVNFHGDTPLHISAREGYIHCVNLFLSRGADTEIRNNEGDTPCDLTLEHTDVWYALQLNRKIRQGILNRAVRTERIISRDIAHGYENFPIPCVNGVDEEPTPDDYKYVSENCETSAMSIDRNITHLQNCSCQDDCSSSNCLCGQLSIRCWYDKDGRLLQEFNKIEPPLIFECNQACACWQTCKNRVVQSGIKVRLQLYRTAKMGWGVRALQTIPQGSFICEYVGELISDAEADVREDDSYLFDLDNKDGEVYCIDARYYGNVSRFINHLCEPNLIPVRVFMSHQDLRFPRIAFFSGRDIRAGEELGFDYGDRFWDIKSKYFTCQCGSERCKHSAEAIALEQSRLARIEVPDSVPISAPSLPPPPPPLPPPPPPPPPPPQPVS
ncbi:histone-lysine N-methyltransferase EHMT2 isoform X3 [Bufo bufo]|uniref:histone-lysine N-methyltransferase EHMT2 isoform X3 n=1 Tax=Bufo bufo TaxID=8384 RepID=UPI001ABECB55|nr:histone-lysine N-methyltransferase EHMT2 isoform X3 [Bufo bufo]